MSVARRPLLTATAAGTLLCALWFVPSANATSEQAGLPEQSVPSTQSISLDSYEGPGATEASGTTGSEVDSGSESGAAVTTDSEVDSGSGTTGSEAVLGGEGQPVLADTGAVNTTPYLFGGTLSLALGAGFVAYSVRRSVHAL
ncbi:MULTISPECIES: cell wall protein [unclassified Streptomyces]|uniref:cell wall protein n=1 Tax=unclassified Streptomyces TaxID=2593676 RepID=UPI0037FF5784